MAYLGRPEESFRNDIMSWRRKKRSSPAVYCDYDNQSSPCKRFASEELVTACLRDLDLSSPLPTPPTLTPSHPLTSLHTLTPSHPLTPHTITPSHPLLVTSLTECPGLVGNHNYPAENQVPSDAWLNLGQPTASWEMTGVDNEVATRGSSSLQLIDDTSCRCSQGRGEEAGPPVYPIQATSSPNRQWTNPHKPSLFSAHHLLPDSDELMSNDHYTDDNGHFLQGDSPPVFGETPSHKITPPEASPVQRTLPWRQVTIEEASSDSSDGASDGPERPLSLWISPELIKHVEKGIGHSLPQSLLEKYNKPVGMEIVLWVDQSTLYNDTKEMDEVEMADSAEPIWDNSDMDS